MRIISANLIAFLCALFFSQGTMAQEVIYQEDFKSSLGDFTIEGFNGPGNDVFKWDSYYQHAVADGYQKFDMNDAPLVVYLVSPEIQLGTSNTLSFGRLCEFFYNIEEDVSLYIREKGSSDWIIFPAAFNISGDAKNLPNTGDLEIPADYDGLTVQFGFKYQAKAPSQAGILHIADFVVKGVKSSAPVETTEIFNETFENGMADFKEEYTKGVGNIWQFYSVFKKVVADAGGVEADSRLISPEITLLSNNEVSFNYSALEFSDLANQVSLSVRKAEGEWTELAIEPVNNTGEEVTAKISIPADFNNSKVQIAIRYAASSGMLLVSNFVVKGVGGGDAPVQKADPQISYEVGDVVAVIGQPFEAPVLNNPNGVEIVYSSKNENVATVDPATGEVVIVAEGFTTITATSVENDTYKSASVNYVLTVKPAPQEGVLFEEDFETSLGQFTVEGNNGTNNNIWIPNAGCARADAYGKVTDVNTNYLVSPFIKLDEAGNVVEFVYTFNNYGSAPIEEQISVYVRENGGEWEKLYVPVLGATSEFVSSGEIVIPASYAGKEVQIGFRYYVESSYEAGVWNIDQVAVRKSATAVEKKDPEISFPEAEYTYVLKSGDFEAPVLNNPYGVEVVYSTSNKNFADVDPVTGKVTIMYDCGTVVITAKSVETEEFMSASASYTIKITDVPTAIEGVTADDIKNGKVFDLQGRRVDKLNKGVYIINGKKIVIK